MYVAARLFEERLRGLGIGVGRLRRELQGDGERDQVLLDPIV